MSCSGLEKTAKGHEGEFRRAVRPIDKYPLGRPFHLNIVDFGGIVHETLRFVRSEVSKLDGREFVLGQPVIVIRGQLIVSSSSYDIGGLSALEFAKEGGGALLVRHHRTSTPVSRTLRLADGRLTETSS